MEQVQDIARQVQRTYKRVTKQLAPYAPYITRGLFVATFVEDGVRVLTEMPHQVCRWGGGGGCWGTSEWARQGAKPVVGLRYGAGVACNAALFCRTR